ncbi:hypothetical protein vseg_013786 [Gypsophila vaccaria]
MNSIETTLLVIFIMSLATCISSDDALIYQMCSATSVPIECEDCMMRYSDVTHVARGITEETHVAQTMLFCADSGAKNLSIITKKLADNTTNNLLKYILNRCYRDTVQSRLSIRDIRSQIVSKSYATARVMISTLVIDGFSHCAHNFRVSGVDMPAPMFGMFVLVTSDFELTNQLLLSIAKL